MNHLKIYEYYYDKNGKIYTDDELEDSNFSVGKLVYINNAMEKYIPELKSIKDRLIAINDDLENSGPLDEEIHDTIFDLNIVLKKWENRPINKDIKKYNL